MEDVDRVDCCRTTLLEAENQIDPVVEVIPHPTGLQRLSMDQNEQTRITLTPRRKVNIIYCITWILKNLQYLNHLLVLFIKNPLKNANLTAGSRNRILEH